MNGKVYPRAISIDCEMVGCGERGHISVLGRIAVVDDKLKILMDAFVRPNLRVTNFRTKWSGLTWEKLKNGESFDTIRSKFLQIVDYYRKESSSGLVFVGHDVSNDFEVLKWTPQESEIRDTSTFFPLRKLLIKTLSEKGELQHSKKDIYLRQKSSLKMLSKFILNINIQEGSHCPREDAKSAMLLYLKVRDKWESLTNNRKNILSSPKNMLLNNNEEDLGISVESTDSLNQDFNHRKKKRKRKNKKNNIIKIAPKLSE